jgi:AcrR family transcriptional regulator
LYPGVVRRTGEKARADVLRAAEAELALHGVAGARIDRIAKAAGVSKERLYAYFGDKQGLFDEVIHTSIRRVYRAVGIEGDDLVAYAGRLAEYFFTHPADVRLLSWMRLDEQCERAFTTDEAADRAVEGADVVRRAQRAGLVDPRWEPDDLLRLILAVATYWASATSPTTGVARHREIVEDAVRRIIQPRAADA